MKATQSDRRQEFSTLSDYYSDNEHPNGLDFKEVNKIAKYREAITKLQRRCECLSQNNERLVRRYELSNMCQIVCLSGRGFSPFSNNTH